MTNPMTATPTCRFCDLQTSDDVRWVSREPDAMTFLPIVEDWISDGLLALWVCRATAPGFRSSASPPVARERPVAGDTCLIGAVKG